MKERLALLARQLKSSPSPGAVYQIGEEIEKIAAQLGNRGDVNEPKAPSQK